MRRHAQLLISRAQQENRGSVAVVFALCIVPLFASVGLAIDYGRLVAERIRLQSAVDAAALSISQSAALNKDHAALKERALSIFRANLTKSMSTARTVVPDIEITKDTVRVAVSAPMPAHFMGVVGYDKLQVDVATTTAIPQPYNLEIALVLDYSSSMTERGKFEAMRAAALEMVEEMTSKGRDAYVRFGLVPFAEHVFLDLPSDYVAGAGGATTWTGCTRDRPYPYSQEDTTPTISDATKWIPDGSSSAGICAEYASRKLKVLPLTGDATTVKGQLEEMVPFEGTHVAVGLEMGWHVVSPNQPFAESKAYEAKDNYKAIVLLTDGEQTVDGRGPGGGMSTSYAEANWQAICRAAKAKGVQLVTVGFDLGTGTSTSRTLLQECASTPADFFDAADNTNLASAFKAITRQLIGKARLTH